MKSYTSLYSGSLKLLHSTSSDIELYFKFFTLFKLFVNFWTSLLGCNLLPFYFCSAFILNGIFLNSTSLPSQSEVLNMSTLYFLFFIYLILIEFPIIFQEEQIQYQDNVIQLLNKLFEVGWRKKNHDIICYTMTWLVYLQQEMSKNPKIDKNS